MRMLRKTETVRFKQIKKNTALERGGGKVPSLSSDNSGEEHKKSTLSMIIAEESEPPETNPSVSNSDMIMKKNKQSCKTSSFGTDSSFEDIDEMIQKQEEKNGDVFEKEETEIEKESSKITEKPKLLSRKDMHIQRMIDRHREVYGINEELANQILLRYKPDKKEEDNLQKRL